MKEEPVFDAPQITYMPTKKDKFLYTISLKTKVIFDITSRQWIINISKCFSSTWHIWMFYIAKFRFQLGYVKWICWMKKAITYIRDVLWSMSTQCFIFFLFRILSLIYFNFELYVSEELKINFFILLFQQFSLEINSQRLLTHTEIFIRSMTYEVKFYFNSKLDIPLTPPETLYRLY